MNLEKIGPGKNIPNDFNVVIEISAHSAPIKFELDKEADIMVVDRFLGTSMCYPVNYGFVPQTLSEDSDPVDALVVAPFSLPFGTLIHCRALGMLKMEDESGVDAKIIAVPIEKVCPMYSNIKRIEDLPLLLLDQIKHFFEHYKDLEKNKWVKVQCWTDLASAHKELNDGVARFK